MFASLFIQHGYLVTKSLKERAFNYISPAVEEGSSSGRGDDDDDDDIYIQYMSLLYGILECEYALKRVQI